MLKHKSILAALFLSLVCRSAIAQELRPNDKDHCNASAIEAIVNDGQTVKLDRGIYYLHRDLDFSRMSGDHFLIKGVKPEHNIGLITNKWNHSGASMLRRVNSVDGDCLIRLVPSRGQRPVGTWGIMNLAIWIDGDGSAIEWGDPSDTTPGGAHNRGNFIIGVCVEAPSRLYHSRRSLLVGPNWEIDRHVPQEPLVRLVKQYDLMLDIAVRGGFIGLELIHCDAPDVRRSRSALSGIGVIHRSLHTRGSVNGVWNKLYCEGANLLGSYIDSGMIRGARWENGYNQHESFWSDNNDGRWFPTPGTASALREGDGYTIEGLPNGKTAENYFQRHCPIKVVETDGTDHVYVVAEVSGDLVKIENSDNQSSINHDIAGASVERCFGSNFVVRGGRTQILGGSIGFNRRRPGLPQGFCVPTSGRMTVLGLQKTLQTEEDNSVAFVADHPGKTYFLRGGMDYWGDFAPIHPLVNRRGWSSWNTASTGYPSSTQQSQPGETWRVEPFMGAVGWDGQGKSLDWSIESGRIVEDWRHTNGRHVYLDGLECSGSVRISWSAELRTTDGTYHKVELRTWAGPGTPKHVETNFVVGPDWEQFGGEIKTDSFSGSEHALISFTGGPIRFASALIKRMR